ncbi:Pimeloyl-ACP methyl ester carboxylesterase [Paenibacillus sp. UNC496MF]|uniref:alpha/beta hydrolase n=1 Tax=Paenibacillus sp. UNC496MF TaxID=1502753 RepID=UPI0008F21BDE|nr:alpha/beta fold hydrolase [Paenibacillus sp. UNC496MF]SFJ42809.1 Pimeloyl-ACP methyl ester carboxylesterase [Paenibacillus sp. UNC496MF]
MTFYLSSPNGATHYASYGPYGRNGSYGSYGNVQPPATFYYVTPATQWAAHNDPGMRQKAQPLTFVLVHGSWADAGFWDGVAAELRKQGHTVYAPEYPGHGADYKNTTATHAMMSKAVADYIQNHDLRDVVLVGHSFGGSVVQKAAEYVPDRLKRIVFIDGFVAKDGSSLADELPPQGKAFFSGLAEQSGNNTIMLPFPFFRDAFVNLAPLELAQKLYAGIKPEPAGPLFEKLDLKKFYELQTPKSYVYLYQDNVLPQGEGYGWHPHMSSRLGQFRLIVGNADHMTYFKTEPKKIAELLYMAGRD